MFAIKYASKRNGQVKTYVEQITRMHAKKVNFFPIFSTFQGIDTSCNKNVKQS